MASLRGYARTLSVLKKVDIGAVVGILEQALQEPDEEFRHRTAAFLADIEQEGVERLLVRRFTEIGPEAQARLLRRPAAVLRAAERLAVLDDGTTRANVVEALTALEDRRSVPILLRYLDDPSVPVRTRARSLLRILAHRYGRQLIDSGPRERSYLRTALALVLRGGEVTVEGLRTLLALGRDGFMLLAPVLREPRSDAARRILSFLSNETSRDAVRCLFYLASSAYEPTRQAARAVLKSRREGAFLRAVAEVLVETTESERAPLLVTLRHLAWEELGEKDLNSLDFPAQRLILEIARSYSGPAKKRVEKIVPFLRSKFTDVRAEALQALRGLPSKLLTPHLEGLLNDPVEAIALRATSMLDPSQSVRTLALLIKQLASPSAHVREEAVRKLSGRTFYLLYARWNDLRPEIRPKVVAALARVDRHFMEQLRTELEHGDIERVRRALAVARELPDKHSLRSTALGLSLFPDPFVRATAARLLGELADAKAREALGRLLEDRDPRVVANALEALAEAAGKAAAGRLVRFLEHPNNRVQSTAAVALYRLGHRGVEPCLRRLLSSADPRMQASGRWALRTIKRLKEEAAGAPRPPIEPVNWESNRVRTPAVSKEKAHAS